MNLDTDTEMPMDTEMTTQDPSVCSDDPGMPTNGPSALTDELGALTDPWTTLSTPRPGRDLTGRIQDPWAKSGTRPWDPLPGESGVDYQRFNYYRRQDNPKSSKRSIRAAYRAERTDKTGIAPGSGSTKGGGSVPDTWHDAHTRYHWDERCRLWDLHNETQLLLAEEREIEVARQERRDALHALLATCMEAIPNLDLSKVTLAQISRAVQVSVQELRKEYGDDTTPGTIQLEALLTTIPADFRSEVIIALRARAGAPQTKVHNITRYHTEPKIIDESEIIEGVSENVPRVVPK